MKTEKIEAEMYFWKNLPKHNLTSQNVIDRNKVNFDDIIKLMEQYASKVSREMDITLSKADINHILDLIRLNEDEGTYINGRRNWQNRNKRLKTIFNQEDK